MPTSAWSRLLAGWPWFRGEGAFPIPAYSEFLPPPRLVRKPYGPFVSLANPMNSAGGEADPWGWPVTEYERALEVRPALERLGGHVVTALGHLGAGRPAHGIARIKLTENPYWPAELAGRAGRLRHERY